LWRRLLPLLAALLAIVSPPALAEEHRLEDCRFGNGAMGVTQGVVAEWMLFGFAHGEKERRVRVRLQDVVGMRWDSDPEEPLQVETREGKVLALHLGSAEIRHIAFGTPDAETMKRSMLMSVPLLELGPILKEGGLALKQALSPYGVFRVASDADPGPAPPRGGRARVRVHPDWKVPTLQEMNAPVLEALGRDLTQAAANGELLPVVGRGRVISNVALVLSKSSKRSVVLTGPEGVGKTAVVEGLAQRIVTGQEPGLLDRRIIQLDPGKVVAGTKYTGTLEKRVLDLIAEIRTNRQHIILFVDELQSIVGAGQATGDTVDAGSLLKQALARDEVTMIGATTRREYRTYIERDPALNRRFNRTEVNPFGPKGTLRVARRMARELAKHHGVRYELAAIERAAELARRFLYDRNAPDSVLTLLDVAGANVTLAGEKTVGVPDIVDAVLEIKPAERSRGSRRRGDRMGLDGILERQIRDDELRTLAEVARGAAARRARSEAPASEPWEAPPLERIAPTLAKLGVDLTEQAARGELARAFGRQRETLALRRNLRLMFHPSSVLVGRAGVGKTAIVENLAREVVAGRVPEMRNLRIVSLSVGGLLAGNRYRGETEEVIRQVVEDMERAHENVLVFIDEGQTLVPLRDREDHGLTIANMLKPALARKGVRLVTATTRRELPRIRKDPALFRRLMPIAVKQFGPRRTLTISQRIATVLGRFHGVTYPKDVVQAACQLAREHMADRAPPDREKDLLDLAGAHSRRERRTIVTAEDLAVVAKMLPRPPRSRREFGFRPPGLAPGR
jgi:ATP-dependent Clp protease ATP-binding subunit ClpA